MKKVLTLLMTAVCLINCKQISEKYFNAEILSIDISNLSPDTLVGIEVPLNDVYAGYMSVYDSILLFVSYSFPEYYLYIYNLNNNDLIGKYAYKGSGPDDYIDFTHAEQFIFDNGSLKLWIRDGYSEKNQLLNLTRTIKNQKISIDSVVFLDWSKHTFAPFGYIFMDNENRILARIQPERNANSYEPDRYELYDIQQRLVKTINIYNKPIVKKKQDFPIENYFISKDRIKSDGSRIVMAMEMLAQINIYDIKENKLNGFRIKDTPDFDYLTKEIENYKIFFRDVCVDDDYIYALYSNVILESNGQNYPFDTNTILVYDWDGNAIKQIILDKLTFEITVDPVNHFLYILTIDDLVYKYDLGYLF